VLRRMKQNDKIKSLLNCSMNFYRNYLVHQEHLLDRLERHIKINDNLLISILRMQLAVIFQ